METIILGKLTIDFDYKGAERGFRNSYGIAEEPDYPADVELNRINGKEVEVNDNYYEEQEKGVLQKNIYYLTNEEYDELCGAVCEKHEDGLYSEYYDL